MRDAMPRTSFSRIPAGGLLETIWVLSGGYGFQRDDIARLLDALLSSSVYVVEKRTAMQRAAWRSRAEGEFADLLFIESAKEHGADVLFSCNYSARSVLGRIIAFWSCRNSFVGLGTSSGCATQA